MFSENHTFLSDLQKFVHTVRFTELNGKRTKYNKILTHEEALEIGAGERFPNI